MSELTRVDQFKKWLKERYETSVEEKVERYTNLGTTSYDAAKLPEFFWDFIDKVDLLYIDGLFIETVLFVAFLLEAVLKDRLKKFSKIKPEIVDNFTFRLLIIICREMGIINDSEQKYLDSLRIKRNGLIHLDEKKIDKLSKRKFGLIENPILRRKYFLMDLESDAFRHLSNLKLFLVKFYGTK